MGVTLRRAIESEFRSASALFQVERYGEAFRHLERAHVLGQRYVRPHTRAHWWMLRVGWRRRDRRELVGQIVRLLVAPLASALGVLPLGNTGGADAPATKPMPVPAELQTLLDDDGRA
jgi:hypothetical protein